MTYQLIHVVLVLALVLMWTALGLMAKNKQALTNFILFISTAGSLLALLGLGLSWLFSKAPIFELATFQKYFLYTFGFDKAYLGGLSMILSIPMLLIVRLSKGL